MKKFFVVGLAAMVTMASYAQTYKPALNLNAGKKYVVTISTKGTSTQEAMGQKMEMPMESVNYQALDIKEATDKGYKASSTVSRMTFFMNMMGKEMTYDSDKKADRNGELGESFNKQVGVITTFDVDKNGKIIESSIKKSVKDDDAADMMAGMMSSMGMSEAPSPAFDLFPEDKELKIGDTFTETRSVNKDGESKSTTVYTLTGIKDGIATFSFTGTGSLTKTMNMNNMEMVTTNNNNIKGEMTVDAVTGLLIKKSFTLESTGKVEVQNTEIPTTSNMVITITVTPA